MTSKTFQEWLIEELRNRNLSQSDLARMSGISQGSISHVISNKRKPGVEFCNGIARAFHIPPEEVYRRAGLLPPEPEPTRITKAVVAIISKMPPEIQEDILEYVRFREEQYERKQKQQKSGQRTLPQPR